MGAAAIPAALMFGGAATSAYAQHKQASADEEAAERATDFNARVIAEQNRIEGERKRRIARRELASQRVAYAKAGVRLEGSPLEVLASNAAMLERDIFEQNLAARRDIDYQRLQRKSAGEVAKSRRFGAGASLLGGAAGAAGSYYQMRNPT